MFLDRLLWWWWWLVSMCVSLRIQLQFEPYRNEGQISRETGRGSWLEKSLTNTAPSIVSVIERRAARSAPLHYARLVSVGILGKHSKYWHRAAPSHPPQIARVCAEQEAVCPVYQENDSTRLCRLLSAYGGESRNHNELREGETPDILMNVISKVGWPWTLSASLFSSSR